MSARRGEISASAASSLSSSEAYDLKVLALALPESWAVQIEPPYGQLALVPLSSRRRYHRCWVASRRIGRIVRDSALIA